MFYPVVIHKDPDSDYGVTVPDLPGCFSAGSNEDEAIQMAKEAVECHIEGLLLDGEAVPDASPIADFMDSPEYAGAFWGFVDVDLAALSGKSERINISVPSLVLRQIDRAAEMEHKNRSAFLAESAFERAQKVLRAG